MYFRCNQNILDMDEELKDVIVLGLVESEKDSFQKISEKAKVTSEELNQIFEKLESRGLIIVNEKTGFFGKKKERFATEKGVKELERRIQELEGKWIQMILLSKSGDPKKFQMYMDENKTSFNEMIFFRVLDFQMFSEMFHIFGTTMTSFMSPLEMPYNFNN